MTTSSSSNSTTNAVWSSNTSNTRDDKRERERETQREGDCELIFPCKLNSLGKTTTVGKPPIQIGDITYVLTFLLLCAVDSEEIDDPRREVESDVVFVLLDGQAVAVTVAGSGHSSTV